MRVSYLILIVVILVSTGCALAVEQSELDNFDRAVAEFQAHLTDCEYPLIHTIQFASRWNLDQRARADVYRFFEPDGLDLSRGLPE